MSSCGIFLLYFPQMRRFLTNSLINQLSYSSLPTNYDKFLQKRLSTGYVSRNVYLRDADRTQTPAGITKALEKSARNHLSNGKVKYAMCRRLANEMCDRINEFTFAEVRTIARSLSILFTREDSQRWSEPIANFALKRSMMMPVNILFPLLNSIAKIGHRNKEFYDQMFEIGVKRIKEAEGIDLVTLSQTLLLLKTSKVMTDWKIIRKVMVAICREASDPRILLEISATNAVLLMYSLAKIPHLQKDLFNSLIDVVTKMDSEEFEPHLVPLILHSCAVFSFRKARPLSIIMDRINAIVEKMTPVHLSNCICSLARLEIRNIELIQALTMRTRELLETIKARELGNIIYGLSNLEYDNVEVLGEFIDKIVTMDCIDYFSCAQVLYAMGHYSMKKKDIITKIVKHFESSIRNVPTLQLAQIAWSCSCLDYNEFYVLTRSIEELEARNLNENEQKYLDMTLDNLKHNASESITPQS